MVDNSLADWKKSGTFGPAKLKIKLSCLNKIKHATNQNKIRLLHIRERK